MKEYNIIKVSNQNTFFYVVGATVSLGRDKKGSYVIINEKKIYGLSCIEFIKKVLL